MTAGTTDTLGAAGLCTLLAGLFREELDERIVQALEQRGLLAHLEAEGYQMSRDRLSEPAFLRRLAQEYTTIFVGPGPHVAPYGSMHHPDDAQRGRLWGETTTWVRRFIMDHGLAFEGRGYDGIPDHVGHELEFYAALLQAEAQARDAGETVKAGRLRNSCRSFFEGQLERWLPPFLARVCERATLVFYTEVARLTEALLDLERERLAAE